MSDKKIEKPERVSLAPSLLASPAVKPVGIIPQNFDDAWRLAQLLAQSNLVPKDYKDKAADCCVAILQGLEIGLSPMAALGSIAIVNGRACLWGDGLLAVVRASGLLEEFDERDENDTATCTVKRKGEKPITRKFSMADARQAKLLDKDTPWKTYPQRMRQMRARSWALRDTFADVLKGISVAEEMQDAHMKDITPKAAPLALDVPDDILPDDTPAPANVSEAEDDQDALLANPQKHVEELEAQLRMAKTEEQFEEYWAAHQSLVEAGRLPRAYQEEATGIKEKHGKRFA